MFQITSGPLTITEQFMPKRGDCLVASAPGAGEICMDFCGMNPMLVPDGSNAYMFGNRLIVVTRWSDMSEEEQERCKSGTIELAVYPFECVQMNIQVAGYGWGDVFFNLHHCYEGQNDENAPVEEIIFIFADTHDSDFLIGRRVKISGALAALFQEGNRRSRAVLAGVAQSIPAMKQEAEQLPDRDFSDLLYDALYEATGDMARASRELNPDAGDTIRIEINADNQVTKAYQVS